MIPRAPIPMGALDDRLGWIGTAGSGKTYNAGSGVERVLMAGGRCVIVDPLGVWWGLRLTAGGDNPSPFKVAIFGGEHGDLPLNEHAGKLIGETVATMAESCIVDLSALGTKESERRFMLQFLESWYRKTAGNPVHAIFDEADLWAPQQPGRGAGPALQALMEQIVRRGRIKGFIPWLITQRPAVISKDVLSQVDGLVAFKLTASQDRDALGGWIEGQADRARGKEILGSLPTMQRGQGVIWVPGRAILETVQFPPKTTFDSSRTPTRGEMREVRNLKPLNLESLKGKLARIEDEQKANDPKALRNEVARLTRELAKAQKVAPKPELIAVPSQPQIDQAEREHERTLGIVMGIDRAMRELQDLRDEVAVEKISMPQVRRAVPFQTTERATSPTGGPGQRILNSLAWWKALGYDSPLNEQVAFVAGYSHNSTGYTNPRSALKTAGLVDYPQPGRLRLTEGGEAQAEAPDAPPTGEELRRRVLGNLAGPQQRILSVLIEAYPDALTNEECAAKAGYSHTSTGYTNPRSNLNTLNLLTYAVRGSVRATDWLFPAENRQ